MEKTCNIKMKLCKKCNIEKEKFLDRSLIFSVTQKIFYMEIILNIFNKKYIESLKMLKQIESVKKKIKLLNIFLNIF